MNIENVDVLEGPNIVIPSGYKSVLLEIYA